MTSDSSGKSYFLNQINQPLLKMEIYIYTYIYLYIYFFKINESLQGDHERLGERLKPDVIISLFIACLLAVCEGEILFHLLKMSFHFNQYYIQSPFEAEQTHHYFTIPKV